MAFDYYCVTDMYGEIIGFGDSKLSASENAALTLYKSDCKEWKRLDVDTYDLQYYVETNLGVYACSQQLYEYLQNPDAAHLNAWNIKLVGGKKNPNCRYEMTTEEESNILKLEYT